MRILQGPTEIAGQMAILSEQLRKHGCKVTAVNFRKDIKVGTKSGINFPVSSYQSIGARLLRGLFFIYALFNYDYFHFHYGRTFLPKRIDLKILRILKKKIIMHFHGADIGNVDFIYYKNENLLEYPKNNKRPPKITKEQKKLILEAKRYADLILVSTPDLLDFIKGAVYFPNSLPIFENNETKSPKEGNDKLLIIHAPTNRKKKGTEFIIKTIGRLKKNNPSVEFELIEGKNYKRARELYKRADIAIDQILQGWYGVFSVELMSLGKPVLCYVRDNLRKKDAPDLPIVSTSPDSLYEDLYGLIKNEESRNELGKRGERYVSENHNPEKQAKELVKLYRTL